MFQLVQADAGLFLTDSPCRNSSGKADPEESAIILRFQHIVDLSNLLLILKID